MKTALIGLSNNVSNNIRKIKIWANSFKKYCDGEVILLCANATETDLMLCEELGIKTKSVVVEDTWYINHDRLKHTFEYIKNSDIDVFLATDVFDVIFQGNPFDKFDLENYDLFVSGEGVLVCEEPWNADNIKKIFPDKISICMPNEVINSGIMGGKRIEMATLMERVYQLCERGSNDHNIKDQAALNVLVSEKSVDRLKVFNLDDGWAMHCAVSGPTQFFVGWGFKDKIKYGIPRMNNGVVETQSGHKFSMVHQFNRIPEWQTILEGDYNE